MNYTIKKYSTLIYLIFVFHLPVWNPGYKHSKYRYLHDMPLWMQRAIHRRNEYERKHTNNDYFYWLRLGRLYIRKNYCYPCAGAFKYSNKSLFCWKL